MRRRHGAVLSLCQRQLELRLAGVSNATNGASAVEIQGSAATAASSGEAMDEIDRLMAQLPQGFSHEWTSLSAQEKLSGNQALALYAHLDPGRLPGLGCAL